VPDLTDIPIEDGKPVAGIFTEKQARLLTEPLYTSWQGGPEHRDFVALADVGLFYAWKEPPLVPDVMLSLDVTQSNDFSQKENLSYFVWRRKKVPEVVDEIVSNREGGEDTTKLRAYAQLRIPYYVIHDPEDLLGGGVLRIFEINRGKYQLITALPVTWLEEVGLGLTLWQGVFEGIEATWLRWCDKEGNLGATCLQLRASWLQVDPNFARPPSKLASTAPTAFGAVVRPTACPAWTCADSAFPLIAVCISKTRHWRARKCPQKKQGPPGTRVTQLLARPPVNACWPVPGSIAPRTRVLLSLILRLPGAVKAWERNRR
jgi:Uma2 family endonuclease